MTQPRSEKRSEEELAVAYALGALDKAAARAFERRIDQASGAPPDADSSQGRDSETIGTGPLLTPPPSLKSRVMAQIALEPQERGEPRPFLFVRPDQGEWQAIGPGVLLKVLHQDPEGARMTSLVRLAPGGQLDAHRHAQVEELYVLEGSCLCAGVLLRAGDYHRAEAGTVHPVTVSEQGCLALVMTCSANEMLL